VEADILEILLCWQLRKIFPSSEVLALVTGIIHSYSVILSCVIWTLVSHSSCYNGCCGLKHG